jgi:hypothetical protein
MTSRNTAENNRFGSAGNYARIYPATNFKRATEPVLRACGIGGNDDA